MLSVQIGDNFPSELERTCKKFNSTLLQAEKSLLPLLETERSHIVKDKNLLDAAKLDLLAVYAINSFYWVYVALEGFDPGMHPIKKELKRIQSQISKVEKLTEPASQCTIKHKRRRLIKKEVEKIDSYLQS